MTFWAKWGKGVPIVWLAALVLVVITAVAASALLDVAVGPGALVLLLLVLLLVPLSIGAILYAVGFLLLQYRWSRNGLTISAGLFHLLVPMQAIAGIYSAPGSTGGLRFQGLRFPGHCVGRVKTPPGKRIIYLATTPPDACLHVVTARRIYAISPADGEAFLRRFETERSLGPVVEWHETVRVSWVLQTLVWRDYVGLGLAGSALLAGLVLLAMAFIRYPGLPAAIPMHFDPLGRPDLMVPPQRIFYLPLVGSCVTVLNSVLAISLYRRERLLSYFLWGNAALVEVLLIVALRAITA
ncbi:MAG: PH domain-containing protein [Anaerolineae bacterium]